MDIVHGDATTNDIVMDIIPFPEHAGWKVSYSENYPADLAVEYTNVTHYGKKTLNFKVPTDIQIGYTDFSIKITAVNSNCEPQTFAFYCVKYEASELKPYLEWSFDKKLSGDMKLSSLLMNDNCVDISGNPTRYFINICSKYYKHG